MTLQASRHVGKKTQQFPWPKKIVHIWQHPYVDTNIILYVYTHAHRVCISFRSLNSIIVDKCSMCFHKKGHCHFLDITNTCTCTDHRRITVM